MCLIIKKPSGRRIPSDFLENAWLRNSHGWGGFHLFQDQVVWDRGLSLDDLIRYNDAVPLHAEVYLHLRKATYGAVTHEMAHPYPVRPDLLLMHNGSISHLAPDDANRSDTSELARHLCDMLSGLSRDQACDLIRSQGFRKLMAPLVDGSMIILMDTRGAVRLGREWHVVQATDWHEAMVGIEVSNTHTWDRGLHHARSCETHPAPVAAMA
ncbi:MAG TPA: hypothetical protein VFM48_13780 [Aquabacterium sp.]|nr:hypothetical protein [Aquabacterium sp.]